MFNIFLASIFGNAKSFRETSLVGLVDGGQAVLVVVLAFEIQT
jgi:hypothetical protein